MSTTVTKESTLYARAASGDQDSIRGYIELVRSYGYGAPQSRQELAFQLADIVEKGKADDEFFKKIALYHPDKDFILQNVESEILPAKKFNDCGGGYHNDCGCSGHHNDTGPGIGGIMPAPGSASTAIKPAFDTKEIAATFIGGSIFLILLIFAMKVILK